MSTALTTADNFDLVTLSGDIAEAIAEEMDGLGQIPYDRVKIPSGGGLAFEVPTDDPDKPESATELKGIILYHHPVNAYWRDKFDGSNDSPDCSSMDGKAGVNKDTGEISSCDGCPYNQFKTDGSGKACKNMHRVYMLRAGNPIPMILTLPPTSIKSMRDYIAKSILLKGMRSYDVVTAVTLKKEKNAAGIAYSRAIFSVDGKVPESKKDEVKAAADTIKATCKTIDVETDDFASAGSSTIHQDGFVEVPEGTPGELPFN